MKTKTWWILCVALLGVSLFLTGFWKPAPPRLGAAAIGVSDLERSVDFYTRVMGMTIKQRILRKGVIQVVLTFNSGKGSDVILMHYTGDADPNYANNPDKLVFYVPDAYDLAEAIAAEGLTILSPPQPQTDLGDVVVGMAMDPDGYWVEMVQDTSLVDSYLGGVGIGVADLEGSVDFYTRVMGMTEQYRLNIPNFMDEVILQYPYEGGGSALVLMHFLAPKDYENLPVKLSFMVTDPAETMADIAAEGLDILWAPKGRSHFHPKGYRLARDPDGYLLELFPSLELKSDACDREAS